MTEWDEWTLDAYGVISRDRSMNGFITIRSIKDYIDVYGVSDADAFIQTIFKIDDYHREIDKNDNPNTNHKA